MKKHLILVGVITTVLTTTGAHAVTKCVALNSSSTTCTYENPGYNVADWTSTCTTNGVSTPISGTGICSSTKGASEFATATELRTSSTVDDNLNCWCKMTSPAVSRWVFRYSYSSAGACAELCVNACAHYVWVNASLRSALFGSLSD